MANSLLFPNATDLSVAEHAKLADAYELACAQLVDVGFTPERLTSAIDPMTEALLHAYRHGIHDIDSLVSYSMLSARETA